MSEDTQLPGESTPNQGSTEVAPEEADKALPGEEEVSDEEVAEVEKITEEADKELEDDMA